MSYRLDDYVLYGVCVCLFVQAEDGIRDLVRSRGLGDVYKRQEVSGGSPYQAGLRTPTPSRQMEQRNCPGGVATSIIRPSALLGGRTRLYRRHHGCTKTFAS